MNEYISEAVQYLRIVGRGVLADEVSDLHKAAATLAVEKAELRAQVAALTAERLRLITACGDFENESLQLSEELARVKALVASEPVVGVVSQYGDDTWDKSLHWKSGFDKLKITAGAELIARPNLEQNP